MTDFDAEQFHGLTNYDDRGCPNCKTDITSDRAIGKMTQEQVELLEADICPWCNYKLQ